MDLKEIREHIDRLDSIVVYALAERMSFVEKVALYKKECNLPRYQPEREKQIIEQKRALAKQTGLNPDLIEDLYKRIIEDAHRIEKDILEK